MKTKQKYSKKPYAKQETSQEKPYAKRETSQGKPYAKRETSQGKPYAKRETSQGKPYAKRETSQGKPYAKRETSQGKPYYKTEKRETHDEEKDIPLNLEGRNAVLEALNHDKPIDKIFIKKGGNEGTIRVITAKAGERRIAVQEVDKSKLDFMSETGRHQGVIAVCPAHEYAEVEDMLELANSKNEKPFIIILEGITDPHNLGAIIRTADAAGAHGVIIPKRRAVGLTATVSKASSGALEHVLVARVPNISSTIEDLKKKNIWVACADINGKNLFNTKLDDSIAVVIGSEGEGCSRLIKERCDFSIKIPMYGKIEALNASVAAGILMYEVVRNRTLQK